MVLKILSCINLILVMLVTGVFWGTWFTLTRSLDVFPPDNFLRIGKTIISNVGVPMSILMPLTLASLLITCIISFRKSRLFYYVLAAFIFMTVSLIITLSVEVPIDNLIKSWTVETIPADWTAYRLRWNNFHTARTVTSILSFTSLAIGVAIKMTGKRIVN